MKSSENAEYADNQQVISYDAISDEYYAGFVDGEGCFYVGFSRREDLPMKWQIITEFHLSQNPGGKNILEGFGKRLGCGYLKPNHPKNPKDKTWVLIVKNRSDLRDKLIPFFRAHRLHSKKSNDFKIFSKALEIIDKKKHLTKAGFVKIVNMVFSTHRATIKKYSKETLLSN